MSLPAASGHRGHRHLGTQTFRHGPVVHLGEERVRKNENERGSTNKRQSRAMQLNSRNRMVKVPISSSSSTRANTELRAWQGKGREKSGREEWQAKSERVKGRVSSEQK